MTTKFEPLIEEEELNAEGQRFYEEDSLQDTEDEEVVGRSE